MERVEGTQFKWEG